MKNKILSMFDYFLILTVFILIALGIMFIYSSGINSEGILKSNEYIKQIIWAGAGIVLMIIFTLYDYRKFENVSIWGYGAVVFILLITLIFGKKVNGARSWLGIGNFGIQPSEFSKIFFILFLAHYLNTSQNENPFKRFIIAGLILILPMGFILVQPDMGTASVFIPIFLIMCFVAGIPLTYILYILAFGLLTIFFAIVPVWNAEIAKKSYAIVSILTDNKLRYIAIGTTLFITLMGLILRRYFHAPKYTYWISYGFSIIAFALIVSILFGKVLKPYQIKRLIIFIDPSSDPLNFGWNIIQSKTAIGSGGLWGQSFLHGTQSHYRFLPQQSTDFIFSILSEELGFAGGLIVFALYQFIFLRMLTIIRRCPNKYGTYIASGIFGMFTFHFFINIGMVMGIMPITGIPLLFLSYGGSSLWTAMTCIGLLMSINYRRKDLY